MDKKQLAVISTSIVALALVAVFVVTWDIPPPTQQVEKVIPDERFPR